ncbi:MAG: DUF1385 domain-containing protein [Clostridiales bacterium]|jgi:uncharacterized protein YqhQ|nr:DUF1385 domain-containing protein [Clostridiales bacterium]
MKKNEKDMSPKYYGGQAVMEGVMMKGSEMYAMAVRKPDGEIALIEKALKKKTEEFSLVKLPVIRGVAAFIDSMVTGVKTLTQSAEIATEGIEEEEEPGRIERFLREKLGDKLNDVLIQFSVVVAVVIAVGLFMLLPTWVGSLFSPLTGGNTRLTGVIEGVLRVGIFVGYVSLMSLSKDVKRMFAYHGAEHKTINCFESGDALTAENVAKHSRLHKRCGTSFLLVVMLISMLVFMFVTTETIWLRFATRILLLPVIAGLAYEVSVKWAGRHDNWLVRAVIFPGMCLQRITTGEPDAGQIEVAITALNKVLEKEKQQKVDDEPNR